MMFVFWRKRPMELARRWSLPTSSLSRPEAVNSLERPIPTSPAT